MKRTRMLALLLVLTFALGSLTACGKNASGGAESETDGGETDGGNDSGGTDGAGKSYLLPARATRYGVHDGEGDPVFFSYDHTIVYGDHSVTVTVFAGENGGVQETYRMEYDDRGNTTLCTRTYRAESEITDYTAYEYEYDGQGRMLSMTEYREEGVPRLSRTYEYGEGALPVKITECSATGNFLFSYLPDYDENGKQTGGSYYNSDGEIESYDVYEWYTPMRFRVTDSYDVGEPRCTYDGQGRLTQKILMNAYGSPIAIHEYGYAQDGTVTHQEYDPDRMLRSVRTEDAAGRVTEQWDYYGQAVPSGHAAYTYDAQGRLTEETEYISGTDSDDDEVGRRYFYEYDASGRLAKRTCTDPGGDRRYHTEYEWYGNGYPLRETQYNSRGMMSRRTEYDPEGFCVLDSEFYEDTPSDGVALTGEYALSLTEAQYLCIRHFLEDIFF